MKTYRLLPALLLLGCDAASPVAAPVPASGILLVTLDTVRADRVGAYGYAKADTRTLDRLAEEGILFENAIAPTPITLPSHVSILTGVYPSSHDVHDNVHATLRPEATLLSEALQRAGWRTAAFVGAGVLDPRFGLDQGFEVYEGVPFSGSLAFRPANKVVDGALRWLDTLDSGEKFFLWIHLYDPHHPYAPPAPWSRRHEDPYDGEIAFCDAQLDRLLGALQQRGLDRELLVAVTADHGESLGEHGEETHGVFLYQSTLRVPLLLAGPPVAHWPNRRVETAVSTADLAPTLLELAGLAPEEMPEVKVPSLQQAAGATPAVERAIYIESRLPYHSYRWRALRGIVWKESKYIQGRRPELYSLALDPGEVSDLAPTRSELRREMEARLAELLEANPSAGWSSSQVPSSAERAMLESLGYAAGVAGGDPFHSELPDPRERMGDLALYDDASDLIVRWSLLTMKPPAPTAWQQDEREAEGRAILVSARALLLELQRNNPDDPRIPLTLGNVEKDLGNHDVAMPLLERSVREEPGSSLSHFSLGVAYTQLGRPEEGLRALHAAIAMEPNHPEYHTWIAGYHQERGDTERAAWWIERLLALLPVSSARYAATADWLARVAAELQRTGGRPTPPENLVLEAPERAAE